MGLLFNPQVIYEHGEPWWSDVNRGELLIFPPEFLDNPTGSKLEEWVKGMMNFAL
jgi:hypothetical protein